VVRAEEGEKERASMIESLKVCDVKHADMHQLQWMLSERCGHHTRARARARTHLLALQPCARWARAHS
jgi:hypothetical protein